MEPDRLPVKYQAGDVRENARSQASTFGEMNSIADFASRPFLFVNVHWYFGISAFCSATATAREAI
jgi:hypothetical protein